MPNPLRKSASSSSSTSEKGSSCLDNKNEQEDQKKKKKGKKKLSSAKYRAILLKTQGKEEEDEKSDKKKKLIVRFKVGNNVLTQLGVKEKKLVAGDSNQVEQGGLNCIIGSKSPNVCVICKLGGSGTGMLLECNRKGCKKNYHLKCVDPPLKDVPASDWHFACCEHSLPGAVESNLDAVETELADFEGVDATKTNLCNKNDSNDSVEKLKEKPARVVASSKFVEYWVPVKLSNVQLEQYCNILLSNSALLCSCSKKDTVEALRDVLISTRKCCDHPYFMNPSLQKVLTKGLSEAEYLKFGIKASGKLQVLDKILSETKEQGLRVVIIFQSNVGSSGFSLGDVLDDVVHQRCGVDSYVRVDHGLIVSDEQFAKTKQTAMNRFNDKETGGIVFLLDRRACHPSIKLSSVDIVIIYDSDLNLYNDLKVLQKISIHSQHEQLKLFRLFSLCTLEEMVLIQAKQGVSIDPQNLNHSTIHQFLRWGASYLFKQLVEFHGSYASSNPIFSSEHLVKELFGPLTDDDSSVVVKVNPTGGSYSRDISLPGELEMQSVDKDLPHVFWTKLLNRKTPEWRYFPAVSSSHRKRVRFFQGSLERADFHNVDVTKKRRKDVSGTTDAGAQKTVVGNNRKVSGANKKGASAVPTGASRRRKADKVSSVPAASMGKPDKISVQQKLDGQNREIQQSCQAVLPLPSEPPKENNEIPEWAKVLEPVRKLPTNVGARIRECVHEALDKGPPEWAKKILQHCISREVYKGNASGPTKKAVVSVLTRVAYEVSHRKPVVVKKKKLQNGSQSGHITSQQAEYPAQLPATDKLVESHSHDVVEPLEAILCLPAMSMEKSLGVSDSRSMGGVPDSINHPPQIAPITSSRTSQSLLHHEPFLNESARIRKDQVGLVINSALQPTYNDALQDVMHQQPMIVDRCIGGSVTRVSDFRSLGVLPDCISHPSPIDPITCSQMLPQDDPLLHELERLRQEWEQVVKFYEELKTQMKSDFCREVQETNKKYSKLHHDNDTAFAQTMHMLHRNFNIFLMNGMLAECFRDKSL